MSCLSRERSPSFDGLPYVTCLLVQDNEKDYTGERKIFVCCSTCAMKRINYTDALFLVLIFLYFQKTFLLPQIPDKFMDCSNSRYT